MWGALSGSRKPEDRSPKPEVGSQNSAVGAGPCARPDDGSVGAKHFSSIEPLNGRTDPLV
uniref:Uncharacterized protein n=1 Tax=Chlorobium phaeobacteroides (strain BS1) TaxID=331678 RepID=B3EQZ9_CHLPB